MLLKYILLVYGFCEFLFGVFIWFSKKEALPKMMVESFSVLSKGVNYENIKDKKAFSRWIGELIMLGGALYTFLASSSIFFGISLIVVIAFIVLIESVFFRMVIKGYKNFI